MMDYNPRNPDPDQPTRERRATPPDGATSTCQLGGGTGCGNEIIYNAERGRWEHPAGGHASCFGK